MEQQPSEEEKAKYANHKVLEGERFLPYNKNATKSLYEIIDIKSEKNALKK